MIAAKGYAVTIYLVGGRKLEPDPASALLHDEQGDTWPKCSGLILPMKKTGQALAAEHVPASVRKYLGADYVVRRGEVVLPPASLDAWKEVGRAERIDYTRRGAFADDWWHPFGESGLLWKGELPVVYRRGKALRLELGSGCVWNWRGFVKP